MSSERKITEKDIRHRIKSLHANFKKANATYHPYFDYIMDEKDVGHWWCRIRNLTGEFTDGEYIIEMFADERYPVTPPKFYALTPNGVYEMGKDICISIGHKHKENYEPGKMGGMMGFMSILLTGIILWRELSVGHGVLHPEYFAHDHNTLTNKAHKDMMDASLSREKQALAKKSKMYNSVHYPDLMRQFNELPFPRIIGDLQELPYSASVISLIRKLISN